MIALYWPLSEKLVNRRERWPPAFSIRVVPTLPHLPGQKWLLHNSNPEFVTWQIHVERFRGMHTKSERELQPPLQNLAGKFCYTTQIGIFFKPMCTWGPIYGSWCQSLTWTNSILTDDTNRKIPSNMAMHLATKSKTRIICTTRWPSL